MDSCLLFETSLELMKTPFSGTVVGTVVSSDPDTGDTLEFHLNDDAEGRFSLGNVTCRTKRLVSRR